MRVLIPGVGGLELLEVVHQELELDRADGQRPGRGALLVGGAVALVPFHASTHAAPTAPATTNPRNPRPHPLSMHAIENS